MGLASFQLNTAVLSFIHVPVYHNQAQYTAATAAATRKTGPFLDPLSISPAPAFGAGEPSACCCALDGVAEFPEPGKPPETGGPPDGGGGPPETGPGDPGGQVDDPDDPQQPLPLGEANILTRCLICILLPAQSFYFFKKFFKKMKKNAMDTSVHKREKKKKR